MPDDPVRVADHLSPQDEHRHAVLAGQRVDLGAVGSAPGHAALLDLDPAAGQLAGPPTAGAEPVRRRAAAVQDGALRRAHDAPRTRWATSSAAWAARPTSRHGQG